MCSSIVWKAILPFRKHFWICFCAPRFTERIVYLSYTERMPRPSNPLLRPAYQGSNPIADVFSLWALRTTVENLPRVAKHPDDFEAMRQMLYALVLFFFFHFMVSQEITV